MKYGFYGFILLVILTTIPIARASLGSSNLESSQVIKNSVEQVIDNNIVFSSIAEAGFTFSVTAVVVDKCPGEVAFKHGLSYVRGLAYILPNGFTGNLYSKIGSADDVFKGYISQYGSGIGSSYIAEAYWNFGLGALLVVFVFGLLLGKLSGSLSLAILNKDYIRIFILTDIFVIISFYVRSETSTFFRNIIWFGLPVVFVAKQMKYGASHFSRDHHVKHTIIETGR